MIATPSPERQPRRVQMSRQHPWRAEHPDAVIVARPSRWGNPFKVGGTRIRLPALDGSEWEVEGRLFKAPGERHAYHHGDGVITWHQVELATVEQTVEMYRAYVTGGGPPIGWTRATWVCEIRAKLAGRDLACWCHLDEPCHADVLLEIANRPGEAS